MYISQNNVLFVFTFFQALYKWHHTEYIFAWLVFSCSIVSEIHLCWWVETQSLKSRNKINFGIFLELNIQIISLFFILALWLTWWRKELIYKQGIVEELWPSSYIFLVKFKRFISLPSSSPEFLRHGMTDILGWLILCFRGLSCVLQHIYLHAWPSPLRCL